jgi:hypothetical protein
MRALLSLMVCLGMGLAVAACSSSGPKLLKVSGKVNDNGAPFKPEGKLMVQIVFIPVGEGSKASDSYPANFKRDDSSFEVAGRTGQGIAAGKYRVSIQYGPKKLETVVEVSGENPLVLDVAKMDSQ